MSEEERQKWVDYLTPEHTPTYGEFWQREPEYAQVAGTLMIDLDVQENDLIIDIGSGSQDMDRYLRESTKLGSFKYLALDGSTVGWDFNNREFWFWNKFYGDYLIAIETIEHLYEPEYLFSHFDRYAKKGAVITTPNSKSVDTLAVDSTHFSCLYEEDFLEWGYEVRLHNFCGRGTENQPDTIIAWKSFNK